MRIFQQIKNSFFTIASLVSFALLCTACSSDSDPEPEQTPDTVPHPITDYLIGEWILPSEQPANITLYEFKPTARVIYKKGNITADGFYWVNDEENTITGSYELTNARPAKTQYIDWTVTKLSNYSLSVKVYDEDKYLYDANMYKILGEEDVWEGDDRTPNYKFLIGWSTFTKVTSLNSEIVDVDETTGKLTGKKAGVTYILITRNEETCALRISVQRKKTLEECLTACTWIYDNPESPEWQSTQLLADGRLAYVRWSYNSSYGKSEQKGSGTYTIDGNVVSITIKYGFGQRLSSVWTVTSFNEYYIEYSTTSGGDDTGKYNGQRLLASYDIGIGEQVLPDYYELTDGVNVLGYNAHINKIASVDSTGLITGIAAGRTYIDVQTDFGPAVVEINVK